VARQDITSGNMWQSKAADHYSQEASRERGKGTGSQYPLQGPPVSDITSFHEPPLLKIPPQMGSKPSTGGHLGDVLHISHRGRVLQELCGIALHMSSLYSSTFIYFFINLLFMTEWIHGYLFYTFVWNKCYVCVCVCVRLGFELRVFILAK
jgi:hypothetical protein